MASSHGLWVYQRSGCRPIVNMGLVKTRQTKCKAYRLQPLKKENTCHAGPTLWKGRHLSYKNCWMCDKYSITINELYSPLEWFVIEKMLVKKKTQQRTNIQTRRLQGITLAKLNLNPGKSPKSPISNAKSCNLYVRRLWNNDTVPAQQPQAALKRPKGETNTCSSWKQRVCIL